MKTKYKTKIALVVFLVLLPCFQSKAFSFAPLNDLLYRKQAIAFVDKVLPEIVEEWNLAKLTFYAHPQFFKSTPRENVEQLFFLFKTLGSLIEYKGAQGEIATFKTSDGEEIVSGTYVAEADFENDTAVITIVIQKGARQWNIVGFQVDSNSFRNSLPSSRHPKQLKDSEQNINKTELEKAVEEIIANDAIQKRRNVDKFFLLAHLYTNEGLYTKALQLYEKALEVDAGNLGEQLAFAKLLLQQDQKEQAGNILYNINKFSENWSLFQESSDLLFDLGIDIPVLFEPEVDFRKDIEIVLIQMGGTLHQQVLKELKVALQNKMGIAVSIAKQSVGHGKFDRKLSDRYLSDVFVNIKKSLTSLQYEMLCSEISADDEKLQTPLHQSRFIRVYFKKIGSEGESALQQFESQLELLRNQGQYYIRRLAEKLRVSFPYDSNEKIKSYIGVSSKNLGDEGSNFLFGATYGSYGVITYYNFTAKINKELPNRSRLVERLLKQALSSVNYTFGISRCNTPFCARAYPHSVAEHDAKSDDLCRVCSERLSEYLDGFKSETSAYEYDYLGRRYNEKEEWDKAIIAYDMAIKNNQDFGQAYEGLGNAYQMKEQYDKAITAYKKAIIEYDKADDLTSGYVCEKMGTAYYYKDQHDQAVIAYKKAAELVTVSDFTHIYLGNHYSSQKEYQAALEHFLAVKKNNPENMDANYAIGRTYYNLGKIKEAITHLEETIKNHQKDAHLYELLGFYYNEQKQNKKAINAYENALRINPDLYRIHYNLGKIFEGIEPAKAIEQYKKAIKIHPSFIQAYTSIGILYGKVGQLNDSIVSLKKAIEIQPENADNWNSLGYTYFLKMMYKTSIEHYTAAIEIMPEFSLAHYNMALAYFAIHEFDAAIIHYDKAINLGYTGSWKFNAALQRHRNKL